MTPGKNLPVVDSEKLFLDAERSEENGDLKHAFQCLLQGAQSGNSSCQLNLGNFYADGKGVRRNLEEAARWYIKAYKNGSSTGALNLAIDRRNGGRIRSAVIWFKKAIEMNDGDACIELAKIYKARKGMTAPAADLLKRTLTMNRTEISDESKEEAVALLKSIETTPYGVAR